MKKLTIEQKAEAYDNLIERLKDFRFEYRFSAFSDTIERYFPELNESGDVKMKNFISNELACLRASDEKGTVRYNELTEAIAWIEKQNSNVDIANKEYWRGYREGKQEILDKYAEFGKQGEHQKFIDAIQIGDKVTRNKNGVLVNLSQLDRVAKHTDEVKPKFKVGDWCIDNEDGIIFQIVKVLDNTYTYRTNEGKEYSCTHYSLENDARLWTIKDAKDGDVLAVENMIFIYKTVLASHVVSYCKLFNNKFEFFNDARTCCEGNSKVHPATREQRDTLMKAMADARYEWDAEKLELKKAEQKPTWSEEEQQIIKDAARFILSCANVAETKKEEERLKELADKLQDLRPQKRWKPSERQMKGLRWVFEFCNTSHQTNVLKELYEELKQL